jgi:CrcB protein
MGDGAVPPLMGWDPLRKSLFVGLGGCFGALARYWLGGWIVERLGNGFPWATFAINVSGSFLLGAFLGGVSGQGEKAAGLRLLVAVGFVGAYTTFSTYEWETLRLAEGPGWVRAMAYALGSLVAGFGAVWLGARLAGWVFRGT